MISINFGKWSSSSKLFFCYDRLYNKGKWTPFVRIRFRYLKTIQEMHADDKLIEPPEVQTNHIKPASAIYGFCAWLTSRDKETIMSAHHDSGIIAQLIASYCDINNFDMQNLSKEIEMLKHPQE